MHWNVINVNKMVPKGVKFGVGLISSFRRIKSFKVLDEACSFVSLLKTRGCCHYAKFGSALTRTTKLVSWQFSVFSAGVDAIVKPECCENGEFFRQLLSLFRSLYIWRLVLVFHSLCIWLNFNSYLFGTGMFYIGMIWCKIIHYVPNITHSLRCVLFMVLWQP